MTLAATQSGFVAMILGEDTSQVTPGERAYHFGYRRRLMDALADTFERTHAWLGDDAFFAAAAAHVARCTSSSWTLDAYGADFGETLAGFYPDRAEVAELAWLDHALSRAFVSADAPAFDMAGLAEVDWERARLVLAPGFAARTLGTNTPAIFQALVNGGVPPEPVAVEGAIAVWRRGLEPHYRTLDAREYRALCAIAAGDSFAAICAVLADDRDVEDATALVSHWLGLWLGEGVVCGVS